MKARCDLIKLKTPRDAIREHAADQVKEHADNHRLLHDRAPPEEWARALDSAGESHWPPSLVASEAQIFNHANNPQGMIAGADTMVAWDPDADHSYCFVTKSECTRLKLSG